MQVHTVDATDPAIIASALGDHRTFQNIDPKTLKKGDFAVLAIEEGRFGAVYYLRSKSDKALECVFDGHEVLGVNIVLGQRATNGRGRALIQHQAECAGLKVEVRNGRDMDGVRDTFHVFV